MFDISINAQNLLEKAIMYTIMAGMAVQFIVSLYYFGKSIHYVWQKVQNIRAKSFLENSVAIKTDLDAKTDHYAKTDLM